MKRAATKKAWNKIPGTWKRFRYIEEYSGLLDHLGREPAYQDLNAGHDPLSGSGVDQAFV